MWELDLKKNLLWSIAETVVFALFGGIYEIFSHQVYSYYMIYAFAIPLLLGVLVYAVFLFYDRCPGRVARNLWNSGVATLGVGCVFRGVLDIYGTTNALIIVYPVAGALLLASGFIAALFGILKKR